MGDVLLDLGRLVGELIVFAGDHLSHKCLVQPESSPGLFPAAAAPPSQCVDTGGRTALFMRGDCETSRLLGRNEAQQQTAIL
jgi:hypothetical protein